MKPAKIQIVRPLTPVLKAVAQRTKTVVPVSSLHAERSAKGERFAATEHNDHLIFLACTMLS